MTNLLKIKLLSPRAKAPVRATDGSAGYDLFAIDDVQVVRGKPNIIPTGIAVAIPPGYYGRVASRSSLSVKYGIEVGAGVIDSDYRGEIKVILHMHYTGSPVNLMAGDKIAQLLITKINTPMVIEVDDLDETERGQGGFGSTGR